MAKENGKGIVQITLPSKLGDVSYTANVLKSMEKEVAVGLSPAQFTARTSITLTTEQSVGILKGMGISLPQNIKLNDLSNVLKKIPKMTQKQIDQYYKKAAEIAGSK